MSAPADSDSGTNEEFSRDRARQAAVTRIAAVVREHMKEEGITSVRGLADHVGMSWKPIDKLLKGTANPPLGTLLQLAHSLDLRSVEELLGPFETTGILEIGRGKSADE